MKKNIVISAILTCTFIITAGVFYSCSYNKQEDTTSIISSLTQEDEKNKSALGTSEDVNNTSKNEQELIQTVQMEEALPKEEYIYIHLCGAVANPDVYQVEAGARLVDIIDLAGGLCEDAAGDYINQAQIVADGQRIYIPNKEEIKNVTADDYLEGNQLVLGEETETNVLVDINVANVDELMNLPGIGKAKADSIIEYRKTNGKFHSIDELMNIAGIKEGLFAQLSLYVTVSD